MAMRVLGFLLKTGKGHAAVASVSSPCFEYMDRVHDVVNTTKKRSDTVNNLALHYMKYSRQSRSIF